MPILNLLYKQDESAFSFIITYHGMKSRHNLKKLHFIQSHLFLITEIQGTYVDLPCNVVPRKFANEILAVIIVKIMNAEVRT